MGAWGRMEYKGLQDFQRRLEKLSEADFDRACRTAANEIAQILLNKVKKRTPVGVKPRIAAADENDRKALGGVGAKKTVTVKGASGKTRSFLSREGAIREQYWSGYVGGTLRDAWTILPIEKRGDNYVITLANNTEYASYVEYGHRQRPGRYVPALGKRLKAGWVKGRFMMTISMQEVEKLAPGILERAVYQVLKGCADAE